MGLFRKKRENDEDSRSVEGRLRWRGEGEREPLRSLIRALVVEYEGILSHPLVNLVHPSDSFWRAAADATSWHNSAMKRALRTVPRADPFLAHPTAQKAIGRALDEFAAHFGVDAAVVGCWGTAELLNKRTRGQWTPRKNGFWWDDLPLAYACLLMPSDPLQSAWAGLLVALDHDFIFTPHSVAAPQLAFTSDAFASASIGEADPDARLIFKSGGPWSQAWFAAPGAVPTTPAIRRAGLLKPGTSALREVFDEAVRDGLMDAASAREILRDCGEPQADGDPT